MLQDHPPWKTVIFLPGPTFEYNWTCHQRPPVLRDYIYHQWGGLSRQVLLYSHAFLSNSGTHKRKSSNSRSQSATVAAFVGLFCVCHLVWSFTVDIHVHTLVHIATGRTRWSLWIHRSQYRKWVNWRHHPWRRPMMAMKLSSGRAPISSLSYG